MSSRLRGIPVVQQFTIRQKENEQDVNAVTRTFTRPRPGESFTDWAMREAVAAADTTAFVNNRIQKRRRRTKLAKQSRKRNRK